jgi:hypothetical protein
VSFCANVGPMPSTSSIFIADPPVRGRRLRCR